jgi:hypothetical protein
MGADIISQYQQGAAHRLVTIRPSKLAAKNNQTFMMKKSSKLEVLSADALDSASMQIFLYD